MSEIFKPWPKTPRLAKPMIITEKIDGTNACIVIREISHPEQADADHENYFCLAVVGDGPYYTVYAQSRNRLIYPGTWTDNYDFAAWVMSNATRLVNLLGPGYHYGEWYGYKIARTYGLKGRRFALFDAKRYEKIVHDPTADLVPGLETVPILYEGPFNSRTVLRVYDDLMEGGSMAVPWFMDPEGVIIYHTASGQFYKYLGPDDRPKSLRIAA